MKRIRPMTFVERTSFPVSAGCVVANGVRETLSTLLAAPVEIRLMEPLVPSAQAWHTIADGANLFLVRGVRSDAAIVLRSRDAVALAAAAFGEAADGTRSLSAVEQTVLERIVRAIAPSVASVCGAPGHAVVAERISTITGFTTYYELLIQQPVGARIGIALARAGQMDHAAGLSLDDIAAVQIEVAVRTEGCSVQASELAAIELGAVVPITVSSGLTAVATIAGRPIARGECGVRGNRLALAIGLAPCTEGGSEPEP